MTSGIIYRGILTEEEGKTFLLGEDQRKWLEDERIWSGYVLHFSGKPVLARRLPQRDYDTGRPILLLWPDEPASPAPFVEVYFNERLVKYPASLLGHLAVNVNHEVFNFSHKINENEALSPEEYFFRPALGEFAPDPETGRDGGADPGKPYHDKFGRLFMRTIHVLRIDGLDVPELSRFLHEQLDIVRSAPPNRRRPGYYADFNPFTRNCATLIRDGFRHVGFTDIKGIFPRDLFVNMAYFFLRKNRDLSRRVSLRILRQLKVPEAAASALSPLLNPVNRWKNGRLPEPIGKAGKALDRQ
jgi:hypothetical protein